MKKLYAFIGILIFWVIIFVVSIAPNERQVSAPDEYPRVILTAQPVDPRDLLRGDFVALRYELNDLSNLDVDPANQKRRAECEELLADPNIEYSEDHSECEDLLWGQEWRDDLPRGTEIYALLNIDPETSRATLNELSTTEPTTGLYLTGKVRDTGWQQEAQFGIEKYFVPAGKGWELEGARNDGSLSAVVAIDPDTGKGLLVDLLINEESVDFSEIEATPYGW